MGQRGNKVLLSLFALDKSCLNINSIERIKILCRRLDIRVPQVVEPGLGTADRGHNGLVCPLDGVQVQVSPRLGGEHQPAVLPHRPQLQPLFCLLGPVALQELHHKGGGGDGTRPVVFQRGENVLAALLPLQLELFVNEDGPTGEVDAIPAQPHDLPLAQTREQGEGEQRLQGVALDGGEKGFAIFLVHGLDILLHHAGQYTGIGGIETEIAHRHSLLQGAVEHGIWALSVLAMYCSMSEQPASRNSFLRSFRASMNVSSSCTSPSRS